MSTKAGSSFATFLLSVPVAAVGLMAVFGIPQFTQVIASPDETLVVRDPYEAQPRYGAHVDGDMHGRYADGDAPRHGDSSRGGEAPRYDGREGFRSYDGTTSAGDGTRDRFSPRPPGASAISSPQGPSDDPYNVPQRPMPMGEHRQFAESSRQEPHWAADSRASSNTNSTPPSSIPPRFGSTPDDRLIPTSEPVPPALSWREASHKLAEMGIDHYHLERGVGEQSFLFVCLFTPRDAPHVTHRFEAETDDPLTAVNQVIGQIDTFLTGRFASDGFSGGAHRFATSGLPR